ncbi:MAG: hypothetical protein M3Y13_12960, partial [Armatimonadota bacterium]|nr:hypothetical protein [Armatimonadota bacterium]
QQLSDMEKADVTVGHGLAHAEEAVGDIPAATAQWQKCVDAHTKNLVKDPQDYAEQASLNSATRQLNEIKLRAKWRPRDTKVPLDMQFHPQLTRVAPMVFVVGGTMNVIGSKGFVLETGKTQWAPADGCRVEVRLEDAGYKMPVLQSYTLNTQLDPNTTIMQDAISVRHEPTEPNGPAYIGGKKGKIIDMSKDHPEIYSFKAPRSQFTFWFPPNNPNDCPLNVQDRIGWMGEGMTDKPDVLDTSGNVPGDTSVPVPHLRMLKKTITLTRADIMGQTKKVWE